jgi:ABC-2 type transport system ATP-binding protein
MQQKIQFIVTVIHNPQLLIFDEPFSGFDPINVNLLKKEIIELRDKGATIIFSTHNMASVEELCDNIMLINKGEKILEGSVYQVKQNFKENKFEVILRHKDTEAICLPEGFTIVSEKENKNEETTFIISSDKENNPNILINYLTEKGTIVSYRELLPSINDIFINKVNGIM